MDSCFTTCVSFGLVVGKGKGKGGTERVCRVEVLI